MKQLVSCNHVIAFRGGKALFVAFDMQVCCGELVVVSGANGIGKTTLLDCLSYRYFDWTGSICCSRKTFSYLPQSFQYFQTAQLCEIAPLVIGYSKTRYDQLLDAFNLRAKAQCVPSLLSGGELQRTRLLLTLLRSHDVLMLDEPFANTDAECRCALLAELKERKPTRATIVVSHATDVCQASVEGDKYLEIM